MNFNDFTCLLIVSRLSSATEFLCHALCQLLINLLLFIYKNTTNIFCKQHVKDYNLTVLTCMQIFMKFT